MNKMFLAGMLFGVIFDYLLRILLPYTISFYLIDGRWGWRIDRKH